MNTTKPDALDGKTITELLDGMRAMGAERMALIAQRKEGRAVGAIVLLVGDNTQRYLDAIDECEDLIDAGFDPGDIGELTPENAADYWLNDDREGVS